MNTYIYRVIATIFGVPIAAYLILQGFNWLENMTFSHELEPLSTKRVQFPLHRNWAEGAVNRFNALDVQGKDEMQTLLDNSIKEMEPWLRSLPKQNLDVVCLGENHDGHIRRLMAEHIFPVLPADILMIEGDKTDAARIGRHANAKEYVPLLQENMADIVRAARAANPAIRLQGIEESRLQYSKRKRGNGVSREQSIEANLRTAYRPGKRHIILYGAYHCSHQTTWLYNRLKQDPPADAKPRMLNIRVAREHIEAPIEAFIAFLDYLDFPYGDIVITDTAALAVRFREWFPFFSTNELEHYSAMIIMRPVINQ